MDMSRSAEKLAEYVGIAAVQGRVFQMVIQVIIFQAHIASILTMHHLNYIEIIQDSWEGHCSPQNVAPGCVVNVNVSTSQARHGHGVVSQDETVDV